MNPTTHLADGKPDWRATANYYPTITPCRVCKSTQDTGIEPRFGYSVCEEHSKLPPAGLPDRGVIDSHCYYLASKGHICNTAFTQGHSK